MLGKTGDSGLKRRAAGHVGEHVAWGANLSMSGEGQNSWQESSEEHSDPDAFGFPLPVPCQDTQPG